MKPGIALLDFGGPRGPSELVPFLTNLLADVLPVPAVLKRPLAARVARSRAKIVGPHYEAIGWSPLVATHQKQAALLAARLGDAAPPMASGMMYTPPTMDDCVRALVDRGVDTFFALPFFPHYSLATTQSAFGMFHEALARAGRGGAPVHWIPAWYDHPRYVRAVASTVRAAAGALEGRGPIHLVFSPHGLPVSFVRKGDPYPEQIRETARRVIRELEWADPWHLGWQSRVGPVRWLGPSTIEVLESLGRERAARVLVVPIAFVSEHIETLHEIDIELAAVARRAGVAAFGRAPALGLEPEFVECLAELVEHALTKATYACVRCLVPQPEAHRRQPSCLNCGWTTPGYLRDTAAVRAPENT